MSGVVAGFTTRFGGGSAFPYDSLNLGLNVGDSPENVAANRAEVAAATRAPLRYMKQIHSAIAIELGSDEDGLAEPEADASITRSDAFALGVLVADCVPIILADAERSVVAVAHAGRAGIQLGIIGSCLAAMRTAGAESISAVVGPAICGRCYEVPEAMRDDVSRVTPAAYGHTREGTPALDLPAAAVAQLTAGGVSSVTALGICTYEDDRFYSHRRATHEGRSATGRFAGFIALER
ncbi:peptidoglycan editing factor PgeF [Rarobacter faecitabidus]|uniref:peptidoglycan editing factor PgeF n=1 Tax=Rarobacter faecitabidus TaxID=13243 RepID=UPI001FE5AE48|nr:peptidoglycan editing factor PgeF [Rarobacter faecitabidus]